MENRSTTLRQLRFIHLAFLITVVLYPVVGYFHVGSGVEVSDLSFLATLRGIFVPVAVSALVAAFVVHFKMVRPAEEILRTHPDDTTALDRWRASEILSCTFAEVAALLGLILQLFGAPWLTAGAFYVPAFLVLLFLFPRNDFPS